MIENNIREEYAKALRLGQKESKELSLAGKDPYPAVLDEILANLSHEKVQELSVQNIPINQIIGTRSSGRVSADGYRTYDFDRYIKLFGERMLTDDLYMGYYLHLIQNGYDKMLMTMKGNLDVNGFKHSTFSDNQRTGKTFTFQRFKPA